MTPDLLRSVGKAIWGPSWQSEMARSLGVAIRTVQRWAAGDTEPALGVYRDLILIVRQRRKGLIEAERLLRAKVRELRAR